MHRSLIRPLKNEIKSIQLQKYLKKEFNKFAQFITSRINMGPVAEMMFNG